MLNNTNALGTLGTLICLAHQYGARAFQVDVTFVMDGLTFRAQRFMRSAATGYACDNVDLYIVREGEWCHEYVGQISGDAPTVKPSRVTARALHLLAVAQADAPSDGAERFALLEMAA